MLWPRRGPLTALFALTLLLPIAGCASWQTGTPTPAAFIERERPARVRVTRIDHAQVLLAAPVVQGDTLIGRLGRPDGAWTAVPLAEVDRVEVSKVSVGKSLLFGWAIMGVVGVLACAGQSGYGCP